MILTKLKNTEKQFKVERIEFFLNTFSVFYEIEPGRLRCVKNTEIEYLISYKGDVIYPNINFINPFSDAIKNAFVSGGGNIDKAEEYYIENFT